MRTTVDVIDAIKRRLSITSDYKLAKALGVTRQAVSNWRSGRNYLAPFHAIRAAELLGEPHIKLIALIQAERTKRPDQKKKWQEIAKVAMYATALIGAGIFSPPPVEAGSVSVVPTSSSLYIMSNRRRTLRSLIFGFFGHFLTPSPI